MLFDPADLSQGPADSVYDSVKDDHEGIEDAGVASNYAPEQYEAQFGEIWVSVSECLLMQKPLCLLRV